MRGYGSPGLADKNERPLYSLRDSSFAAARHSCFSCQRLQKSLCAGMETTPRERECQRLSSGKNFLCHSVAGRPIGDGPPAGRGAARDGTSGSPGRRACCGHVSGNGDGDGDAQDGMGDGQRIQVAIAEKHQAGQRTPDDGERRQNRVGQVGEGKQAGRREGRPGADWVAGAAVATGRSTAAGTAALPTRWRRPRSPRSAAESLRPM